MTVVNKYRIWCETEAAYVYEWAEAEPLDCPNDSAHSIDVTKTVIDEVVGDDSVDISETRDELNRPYIRVDSRDDHDTTYFITRGDSWTAVVGEAVGTGDGATKIFSLDHKEVRNLTAKLDGVNVASSNVSADVSTFIDGNKNLHWADGEITFDTAPSNASSITVDYEYAFIGDDSVNEISFDFSTDSSPKTIYVEWCDPIHIKDGVVYFSGGAMDSKIDVWMVCPQGKYYLDNNRNPAYAFSEVPIAYYVVNQIMSGDAEAGIHFDVESRSTAIPNGYKLKAVINKGSSNILKGCLRVEINRERTVIL